MNVPVSLARNPKLSGHVVVEKADCDGDVYLDISDSGSFFDRASARRLARALIWAARPTKKRPRRAPRKARQSP